MYNNHHEHHGHDAWDALPFRDAPYTFQDGKYDEPTSRPTSPTPDRTLALLAATSRLSLSKPIVAEAPPLRVHRQLFFSIVDSEIVERNPKLLALNSLQMLLTITQNVLKKPEEEKFKSLKLTNPLIQKNIVRVPGAVNYLMACKFAPAVKEHLEYLCFPKSPTPRQREILALGHETLEERIASRTRAWETEEQKLKKEREEEQLHRTRALENICDDRERQQRRQCRERLARERQAQEPELIQ